mmetsp:Transcript_8941/g.29393  ORF Transcript_8941/g.29393 Transcript_8941/m.29393 type:complete len:269 (-) Transcript_8941:92-898(-)
MVAAHMSRMSVGSWSASQSSSSSVVTGGSGITFAPKKALRAATSVSSAAGRPDSKLERTKRARPVTPLSSSSFTPSFSELRSFNASSVIPYAVPKSFSISLFFLPFSITVSCSLSDSLYCLARDGSSAVIEHAAAAPWSPSRATGPKPNSSGFWSRLVAERACSIGGSSRGARRTGALDAVADGVVQATGCVCFVGGALQSKGNQNYERLHRRSITSRAKIEGIGKLLQSLFSLREHEFDGLRLRRAPSLHLLTDEGTQLRPRMWRRR